MAQQKLIDLFKKLEHVETQVIETGDTSEGEVELDKLHKEFMELFKEDKEASLIGVLNYLSGSFPTDTLKVPPPPREYVYNEMEIQRTHLMRSRIADLIEMSLKEVPVEELQKLGKLVEKESVPDAKFNISDIGHLDRVISCMQMAVPFYGRDDININVFELLNTQKILDQFDKVPEERKVDFLKALAELSSITRAHVSEEMFPSVVKLLQEYMSDENMKFERKNSSTNLECGLYVYHRLAHKVGAAHATREVPKLSTERLNTVMSRTRERIRDVSQTLIDDSIELVYAKEDVNKKDKIKMVYKFRLEKRMLNTITELRTCINILAMTEVLLPERTCFVGDKIINLSWKEPRKPLALDIKRDNYLRVQDRPNEMKFLPKDCLECLKEGNSCDLNESQAKSLVNLTKEQLRSQDGRFLLHDDTKVAALFWKITERELRKFVKRVSWKGISGKIRDQLYHLLCWAYVSTDLVSSLMCQRNGEVNNVPLCTWYLCAFTDPKSLGKDERADPKHRKPEDIHHCYGATIENALSHIQAYGIPREIFAKFDCKIYQPPTSDEPWMNRRKIKSVRRISSLEEAMGEVCNHPIGADLVHYSGMFSLGKRIYYGPLQTGSHYIGYHGVFIEGIEEMEGELVAVCKLSNGLDSGDNGYVYVSLATKYFPVGAIDQSRRFVRGLSEPSHLLSNFMTLELDVGEEEEEKERKRGERDKRNRREEREEEEERDRKRGEREKRKRRDEEEVRKNRTRRDDPEKEEEKGRRHGRRTRDDSEEEEEKERRHRRRKRDDREMEKARRHDYEEEEQKERRHGRRNTRDDREMEKERRHDYEEEEQKERRHGRRKRDDREMEKERRHDYEEEEQKERRHGRRKIDDREMEKERRHDYEEEEQKERRHGRRNTRDVVSDSRQERYRSGRK